MRTLTNFLVLPREVSEFERGYLKRLNRIALAFLALHVPAFMLIAWLNRTGPVTAGVLGLVVLAGPLLGRLTSTPRGLSVLFGPSAMFMGALLCCAQR